MIPLVANQGLVGSQPSSCSLDGWMELVPILQDFVSILLDFVPIRAAALQILKLHNIEFAG